MAGSGRGGRCAQPAEAKRELSGIIGNTVFPVASSLSHHVHMSHQRQLAVSTGGRGTQDITARVNEVVRDSGIDTGLCHVFVLHTSCSLTITENADPDVRRDLETLFARLAPDGDPAYVHDLEGPDDMAAHARSVLSDTGLTVPVSNGRLRLGTWQGIFLWEHRAHGSTRRLVVTVMG